MCNMKFLLIFSLFVTICLAENPTCATHPALLNAKSFFEMKSKSFKGGSEFQQELLDLFMKQTPEIKNEADLGVCSQFTGELSCCSKDHVDFIDFVSTASVTATIASPNVVLKLANLLRTILIKSSCSTTIHSDSEEDIINNPLFPKIMQMEKDAAICKVDFAKAIARINRGALCSMCMGIDKVSDYFSGNKLIIKSQSQNEFIKDVNASFDCLAEIIEDSVRVKEVINEVFDYYIVDTQCLKVNVSNLKFAIAGIFLNNKTNGKDSDNNHLCTGSVLFSDRANCEQSILGNSKIDSDAESFQQGVRMLNESTQSDVVVSSVAGISSYIFSVTDDDNNVDGKVYKGFHEVQTITQSDDSSSSDKFFTLIGATLIFTFLL